MGSSGVVGTAQDTADGFERSQGSRKGASGGMETAPIASLPPPPPQQAGSAALNCPRCDSTNTKFCYYNNYSRAQPRHFCRACRRHWTNGGTLRNVPVGGRRKAKRTKSAGTPGNRPSSAPNSAASAADGTKAAADGSAGFAAAVGQPSQAPQVLPPPDFGHLLRAPPPLPGYTNAGDDVGSSFLSALLSLPPAPPHFGSGLPTSVLAVGDDRGYTRAPASLFGPSQLISFPTQEDILAGSELEEAISIAAPWDSLPPPYSCCSCPGGDTAVLEPCSPSSCFWGSCWDDLTGVLFPDPTHASPPPPPPPKQDLQLS